MTQFLYAYIFIPAGVIWSSAHRPVSFIAVQSLVRDKEGQVSSLPDSTAKKNAIDAFFKGI